MLTLLATNSVQGGAGTGSVITYTITGLDNAVPKVTQGQLSASPGSLYAATGSGGYVSEIDLVNTSASPVAVTMYVNGVTASNQIWTATIPANGKAIYGRDGWKLYDVTGFLQYVGSTGPQGLKGARWLGAWSGATTYVIDDVVFSAGSAWIAIAGGTNHIPPTLPATSDSFWNAVSIKGDQGIQGIQGNPGVLTTVTAGAGLTGGGSASTVTLDVVANADGSIVVAADDVKVGVLATDAQHGSRGNNTQHTVASGATAGFYTDEMAQDAVGVALTDTATIDLTYNDGANTITADVIPTATTAALNLATLSLKGLESPAQFKKLAAHFDAEADFGLVGDLRSYFDGACSTGAPTKITSATAAFVAGDVGKRITLCGAAASGAVYAGTISAIDSGTQVTVSPSISTTVSGKGVQVGTDNTTAINNMVTYVNTTAAAFPGVNIEFGQSPTNAWGWPVRAVFTKTVQFIGIGGGYNIDSGDYTRTGGTRLAWWGTTEDGGVEFGAWITIEPSSGPQAIIEPAFRNIWFDGRNGDQAQALIALKFAGVFNPILEDVFFIDSKVGVLCESTPTVLSPVNTQGVIRPHFRNVHSRLLEGFVNNILTPITTSSAITLTNTGQNITVSAATMPVAVDSRYAWIATHIGNPVMVLYTGGGTATLNVKCSPGDAIYAYATVSGGNVASCAPNNGPVFSFSGNTTSNTNCGLILHGQHSYGPNWGPAMMDFRNSDSMDAQDIYFNGGNNTNDGAINRIRRPGIRFAGHNTDVGLACRNTVIRSGDPGSLGGGGVSSMGVLNTGAKMGFPAGPNYYDLYQLGNGAPIPVVEPFASFMWTPNGGLITGMGAGSSSVANQAIAAATLTMVTGTLVALPPQWCQAGTTLRWTILGNPSVGAAAASVWAIRLGPLGTTADPTVFQPAFAVGAAGTVNFKQTIELTVRVPGAPPTAVTSRCNATLLNQGVVGITNLAVQVQAAAGTAFNANTSGILYAHISFQGGAGVTTQIEQAWVEVINPSNP